MPSSICGTMPRLADVVSSLLMPPCRAAECSALAGVRAGTIAAQQRLRLLTPVAWHRTRLRLQHAARHDVKGIDVKRIAGMSLASANSQVRENVFGSA
jgi:hypothetical protein